MIALDEDALICDLAETYNIYDYRGLPLRTVATLSCGLRDNSRIKMKFTGAKLSIHDQLLAVAVDKLSWLVWAKTEDGANGTNRPASIYGLLMGIESNKENGEVNTYNSPEAFEEARRRILEGG